MDELNPMVEQMLRAQGFGDAELDELRRRGRVTRGDGTGATIEVNAATAGSSWSVDDVAITGATIPPEALARLRQFHRFIPKQSLYQLEAASGQDIDGDGNVGMPPLPQPSRAPHATTHPPTHPHDVTASPAMASIESTAGDGPFVQQSATSKLLPALLALVAVAGVVTYVATR